jgi:hypothetical protein
MPDITAREKTNMGFMVTHDTRDPVPAIDQFMNGRRFKSARSARSPASFNGGNAPDGLTFSAPAAIFA